MHKRWRLDGQTALITGASAGIGLAAARELAALGADGKADGEPRLLSRGIDGDVPGKPFGDESDYVFAPDGRSLVFSVRIAGKSEPWSTNFDLYQVAVDGEAAPRNLTDANDATDTNPVFSADGRSIYFVSDRGGAPQIYRVAASGGSAERVTFTGSYNISPAISPDGRWLAYITRSGGGSFKLQVMELATGTVTSLTDTTADESPSFSPNGKLIVYATRQGGREALMTTTLDGKIKARLAGQGGDIREPDWGPFGR